MPLLPVHIRPFQIRPKFDDQSMVEFRGSSVTKTEAVANVSVVIAWSAAPSRESLNKQAVQITTLIARHSLHRLLAPSILINHQSFIIHIHYITSSLITNHSSFITLSLGLCWLTLAALRFEPTPQFTPCGTSEGQVITPSLTYSLTFKWEVRSGCIYRLSRWFQVSPPLAKCLHFFSSYVSCFALFPSLRRTTTPLWSPHGDPPWTPPGSPPLAPPSSLPPHATPLQPPPLDHPLFPLPSLLCMEESTLPKNPPRRPPWGWRRMPCSKYIAKVFCRVNNFHTEINYIVIIDFFPNFSCCLFAM
jgi:hypothetical protein